MVSMPRAAAHGGGLFPDLWLQVWIMAANFKGLVGSVFPATACCYPCGPFVRARRWTKNKKKK